ncbi:hypothetical protein B0A49_12212 [Cryomyces minteri]|uniref:Glutathione S-transferase 2 n=1 Tax=Cryomyces minteri TaxID=331657 RepID=A0A4U0WS91_9PEZI|nr:hypothetical protein B0A49_12212 [Cryomyces minteri]
MSNKPILLYSHASGPNPWKVAILLEELGLPYETKYMDFPDLKKEPFESVNPNGRVPAIEDPNTGIALWEVSGAIIEYLEETYDKENKFQYTTFPEKFLSKSWLFFQVSGQGPYFGQKAWFSNFHPEKNLTSAIDRYANEIKRVIGVIDSHLKKQGTEYLVGDKCTYADLVFISWQQMLPFLMMDQKFDANDYPHFKTWNDKLMSRPTVKKVFEEKQNVSSGAHK